MVVRRYSVSSCRAKLAIVALCSFALKYTYFHIPFFCCGNIFANSLSFNFQSRPFFSLPLFLPNRPVGIGAGVLCTLCVPARKCMKYEMEACVVRTAQAHSSRRSHCRCVQHINTLKKFITYSTMILFVLFIQSSFGCTRYVHTRVHREFRIYFSSLSLIGVVHFRDNFSSSKVQISIYEDVLKTQNRNLRSTMRMRRARARRLRSMDHPHCVAMWHAYTAHTGRI